MAKLPVQVDAANYLMNKGKAYCRQHYRIHPGDALFLTKHTFPKSKIKIVYASSPLSA